MQINNNKIINRFKLGRQFRHCLLSGVFSNVMNCEKQNKYNIYKTMLNKQSSCLKLRSQCILVLGCEGWKCKINSSWSNAPINTTFSFKKKTSLPPRAFIPTAAKYIAIWCVKWLEQQRYCMQDCSIEIKTSKTKTKNTAETSRNKKILKCASRYVTSVSNMY